jgi:hypothetical protein
LIYFLASGKFLAALIYLSVALVKDFKKSGFCSDQIGVLNIRVYSYYLNGYPKFQRTKEYLVPFVTGLTLCQRKEGNTIIEPLGNISFAFIK